MSNPLERLLSKLPDATPSGTGWLARCPAHDDATPSLSVSEGEDGRALICCHAGCAAESIVAAMGLAMADLMPIDGVDADRNRTTSALRTNMSTRPRRTARAFQSHEESLQSLDTLMLTKQGGRRAGTWRYTDPSGELVAIIVRYDLPTPDGGKARKTFRPISRHDDGWCLSDPTGKWPLYRATDLASADQVYVCEGEKAVDAARAVGLVATTSAHGAKSPRKSDWEPLAGKSVVVLPDNDPAGQQYAETVTTLLQRLTPPAVVRVVQLPGVPCHGDMDDFLNSRRAEGKSDAEVRAEIDGLANATEASSGALEPNRLNPYVPFPTSRLPAPLCQFIEVGAEAIGCDVSFVALPILAAMAAAIGNTRRIELKHGWTEPAVLWTAIIGDSGSMKSPALELSLRAVRDRQQTALQGHYESWAEYRVELEQYERDIAEWRKSRSCSPPPETPAEPIAERFWCDDLTMEALAALLQHQWRGLLMCRDELAGWLSDFDRYSQAKGGTVARWLEMFGGRSMIIDRKTGQPRTMHIARAAVSVTGGIQPEILKRCLVQQYRDNGLAARILLAYPPRRAKQWTEAEVDPAMEAEIAGVFNRLYQLTPYQDVDGAPQPVVVCLTPEAKALFVEFYNEHAQEHIQLVGDLSAAWSKLEGYAARLALVVHFIRWASRDATLADENLVDAISIEAGIALSRWFGNEARRIYAVLDESDEERDRRQLVELIVRRGGPVTARDLMRASRAYSRSELAEAALDGLVRNGFGSWQSKGGGGERGRPTREFILSKRSTVDTNDPIRVQVQGCVNVSTPCEQESEWEEI